MRSLKRFLLGFLAILPLPGVAFAAQTALTAESGAKEPVAKAPGGGTSR